MDPRLNPYAPGAGITPVALIGREEILHDFSVAMQRMEVGLSGSPPLITGARGSGKTVLMNCLLRDAKERGWYIASEEVIPDLPLPRLIAVLAREVLLQMSARHRRQSAVNRALGVLKAFTSVSGFGLELNIDAEKVSGTADTGIFDRDLRQLFIEIGEVARMNSTGVVIALDEMQSLGGGGLDSIYSALHQTAQRGLPVALVGAGLFPSWQSGGSERPDPTRMSTYPSRMTTRTYVRLHPLTWSESARALAETSASMGVAYTEHALAMAVDYCEGNPWIIQMIGAECWNYATYPQITDQAVAMARAKVDGQLGQWFFPRLLRSCSEEQLSMLIRLARFDDRIVPVYEFGGSPSATRPARNAVSDLAQIDLVTIADAGPGSPYRGQVCVQFSVPRLREYLRHFYRDFLEQDSRESRN